MSSEKRPFKNQSDLKRSRSTNESETSSKTSLYPVIRRVTFFVFGILLITFGLFLSVHGKGIVLGGLPLVFGLFSIKETICPYKKRND